MPSRDDHLSLAKHNQDVIDFLRTDSARRFHDWVAIVAFYKALHLIEALFACFSWIKHGGDHATRERILKSDTRYDAIRPHYRALKEASSVARYLSLAGGGKHYNTFGDYMTVEDVDSYILSHRLRSIEKSAMAMLFPPAKNKKRKQRKMHR